MAKTKADALTISLEPTPKAAAAVSLLTVAQGVVIVDKDTHVAAREHLKAAKALKREIEAHYAAIKEPLNKTRNTVLDLERQHLAPVLQAIALLEQRDTAYVRAEQRRVQEETDRLRAEEEAKERARREQEAAEAEAAALKLEEASPAVSAREQQFVNAFVASDRSVATAVRIAKTVGYKDAAGQVARFLVAGSKIHAAIAAADKAAAIRREADAKKAAPITVTVHAVEAEIGKVSGTSVRTYYSCGDVDLRALVLAVADDIVNGDGTKIQALQANTVYLNGQARDLREMFSRVHPYAQLVKRDGVAG